MVMVMVMVMVMPTTTPARNNDVRRRCHHRRYHRQLTPHVQLAAAEAVRVLVVGLVVVVPVVPVGAPSLDSAAVVAHVDAPVQAPVLQACRHVVAEVVGEGCNPIPFPCLIPGQQRVARTCGPHTLSLVVVLPLLGSPAPAACLGWLLGVTTLTLTLTLTPAAAASLAAPPVSLLFRFHRPPPCRLLPRMVAVLLPANVPLLLLPRPRLRLRLRLGLRLPRHLPPTWWASRSRRSCLLAVANRVREGPMAATPMTSRPRCLPTAPCTTLQPAPPPPPPPPTHVLQPPDALPTATRPRKRSHLAVHMMATAVVTHPARLAARPLTTTLAPSSSAIATTVTVVPVTTTVPPTRTATSLVTSSCWIWRTRRRHSAVSRARAVRCWSKTKRTNGCERRRMRRRCRQRAHDARSSSSPLPPLRPPPVEVGADLEVEVEVGVEADLEREVGVDVQVRLPLVCRPDPVRVSLPLPLSLRLRLPLRLRLRLRH